MEIEGFGVGRRGGGLRVPEIVYSILIGKMVDTLPAPFKILDKHRSGLS